MTELPLLQVKLLTEGAKLPTKGSNYAAGYDLYADRDVNLFYGDGVQLISTGISIVLPEGTYGRIAPRSGLSLQNIHIAAGVVDRDYRGEVKVAMYILLNSCKQIYQGDRIAQLIIEKIQDVNVVQVNEFIELENNDRMKGGFGSTGK